MPKTTGKMLLYLSWVSRNSKLPSVDLNPKSDLKNFIAIQIFIFLC